MIRAQNKNMRRKRRQGNTTPQKTDNSIINLVESEGDESPLADFRRMMIMFNELKENR
jgi:hypothetical protein